MYGTRETKSIVQKNRFLVQIGHLGRAHTASFGRSLHPVLSKGGVKSYLPQSGPAFHCFPGIELTFGRVTNSLSLQVRCDRAGWGTAARSVHIPSPHPKLAEALGLGGWDGARHWRCMKLTPRITQRRGILILPWRPLTNLRGGADTHCLPWPERGAVVQRVDDLIWHQLLRLSAGDHAPRAVLEEHDEVPVAALGGGGGGPVMRRAGRMCSTKSATFHMLLHRAPKPVPRTRTQTTT